MTQNDLNMNGVPWGNGTTGCDPTIILILNTANLATLLKAIFCLRKVSKLVLVKGQYISPDKITTILGMA